MPLLLAVVARSTTAERSRMAAALSPVQVLQQTLQLKKVLQQVSSACSVSELAAAEAAVDALLAALRGDPSAKQLLRRTPGLFMAACNAASAALHITAAQRSPPTSEAGWCMLSPALICSARLCTLALELLEVITAAEQEPPPAVDEAAAKSLMMAVAAAGNTAAAHLGQPGARTHIMLPQLARAVLLSSEATLTAKEAALASGSWACALDLGAIPIFEACGAEGMLHGTVQVGLPDSVRSDLTELRLLRLGLQAAALHQRQAGQSCIPADPMAAASLMGLNLNSTGGSSSSNTSSSSSGSAGSQPPSALLAVPAFHQALLRQVPHVHLMLQQPAVTRLLMGEDSGTFSVTTMRAPTHIGVVAQLQVLVELAVLQAEKPALVCDVVQRVMTMALDPVGSCSGRQQAGGANKQQAPGAAGSADQDTAQQLQPAQAAGLLAPVLHLLSAAVLHVLGPPGEGVAAAADPLSSAQQATLTGEFCALVAAVVLPVEPKHLAAAICAQPLRSLAALEMTLRLWAAGRLVLQLSGAVAASSYHKLAQSVAEACFDALDSGKLVAALQGSDSATSMLLHNHLLSLLASCLKCCSSAEACGAAVTVAVASRLVAGLGVSQAPSRAPWLAASGGGGSSSSSSSGSQAAISCHGATHCLFLMGRSLVAVSQQSMQFLASQLLAHTHGVRASLGLQEGELALADAAAVIRAAGRAATGPGAEPRRHEAQQQVDDVAAAVGGAGLMSMALNVDAHKSNVAGDMLLLLQDSLAQLAHISSSSSSSSSSTRPETELLQQLAQAASDVRQQLVRWRCAAQMAACQFDGRSEAGCVQLHAELYTVAVWQGNDGVCVLLDSQGQPTVKQHGLLNVLHHLQRLQRLGAAVCAVLPPPSLCCANPACDNVSGLSDMQLVWRRGVCSYCRATRFCSGASCLRAHFAAHRDPGSLVEAVLGGDGV